VISDSGEIELPRLRQGLYRFFAVAFLPPGEANIARLDPAAQVLQELGVDSLAFAQPWLDMRQTLSTRPSLEALHSEYVNLFESGSDGALCPAIESFYVASPRHGGPALVTADLEVEYQRLGTTVADGHHLDVDHICPQLDLMALLCAREVTAGESGDIQSVTWWNHEQREFTDNHLSHWVPRFATRVREVAPKGLYRALVVALDAFIDHDRELLHVLAHHERAGTRT
jgi:TorA maturation chaperone TorD